MLLLHQATLTHTTVQALIVATTLWGDRRRIVRGAGVHDFVDSAPALLVGIVIQHGSQPLITHGIDLVFFLRLRFYTRLFDRVLTRSFKHRVLDTSLTVLVIDVAVVESGEAGRGGVRIHLFHLRVDAHSLSSHQVQGTAPYGALPRSLID